MHWCVKVPVVPNSSNRQLELANRRYDACNSIKLDLISHLLYPDVIFMLHRKTVVFLKLANNLMLTVRVNFSFKRTRHRVLSWCGQLRRSCSAKGGHPSLSVTMLLVWKQVSHLMFPRPLLTFSLLFIYFLLQFYTWSFQIELFLPPVLSAEWLTALGMPREKRDGQRTDTHTADSINLLRRSPSQIFQKFTCRFSL